MAGQLQECANCGKTIGRLEQRVQWRGETVCVECSKRLPAEDGDQPGKKTSQADSLAQLAANQAKGGKRPYHAIVKRKESAVGIAFFGIIAAFLFVIAIVLGIAAMAAPQDTPPVRLAKVIAEVSGGLSFIFFVIWLIALGVSVGVRDTRR